MGNVTFSAEFKMVNGGDALDESIEVFHNGLRERGVLSPAPWLFDLFKKIPGATWKWHRLGEWAKRNLATRREVSSLNTAFEDR